MTNMKEYRSRKELTLHKAAELLKVSARHLQRWEAGASRIPANIIPRIKEVYGLTDGQVMALLESEAQRKGA